MKTCRQYEDMISAFIDGALSEQERAVLMEHMASCPACQDYFDQQIAIHDALMDDAAQQQVPEGFAEDIMARVRFTAQEKPRRRTAVHWRQWAALAACCAIAAAGLWHGTGRQESMQMNVTSHAAADLPGGDAAAPEVSRAVPEAGGAAFSNAADDANKAAPPAEAGTAAMDSGAAAGTASDMLESALEAVSEEAPEPMPELDTEFPVLEQQMEEQKPAKSVLQGSALPTPTADAAEAEDGIALQNDGGQPVDSAVAPAVLTTASPAAAAWVEEQLGLPWTPGARYELTAGEYTQLLAVLTEAGDAFTESWEETEGFLLIAQTDAETD